MMSAVGYLDQTFYCTHDIVS